MTEQSYVSLAQDAREVALMEDGATLTTEEIQIVSLIPHERIAPSRTGQWSDITSW